MSRHRVLLIRPWDAARAGSGCCGGTASICVESWTEDAAPVRQVDQRPLGEVYLAVRAGLPPDVAVEIVDPGNTLFLLPAIIRDGRRHHRSWRALLRDLTRAPGYAAIIVDGRVVSDAHLPDPEQALRLIRAAIESSARSDGGRSDGGRSGVSRSSGGRPDPGSSGSS